MTETRWSIEGSDGTGIELEGRKFSSNDEGAPMMCNLVCSSINRHIHFDYCRTQGVACSGEEIQHIDARTTPNPDKPKDAITHQLYWRRMGKSSTFFLELPQSKPLFVGFKGSEQLSLLHECVLSLATDPYTHDEQMEFRKWCAILLSKCCKTENIIPAMLCALVRPHVPRRYVFLESHDFFSGKEHHVSGSKPSYCTLPMFHTPKDPAELVGGHDYISADGHLFSCKSPAEIQQGFHV